MMYNALCTWDPVDICDGYNVYLSNDGGATFTKQNDQLIPDTQYTIEDVPLGDYQAYATTMYMGMESEPSLVKSFEIIDISSLEGDRELISEAGSHGMHTSGGAVGWSFIPNVDIVGTRLMYSTDSGNDNAETALIKLWEKGAGTLLAESYVQSPGGTYGYANVDNVLLEQGVEYMLSLHENPTGDQIAITSIDENGNLTNDNFSLDENITFSNFDEGGAWGNGRMPDRDWSGSEGKMPSGINMEFKIL